MIVADFQGNCADQRRHNSRASGNRASLRELAFRNSVVLLGVISGTAAAQLPPPPVPPQNPITESKRVLGKILFWEEQLSSDNTVSCGTCHQPFQAATESRHGVHPGLDLMLGTPDDVFGSPGVARQDAAGNPISDPVFGNDVQVTRRSSQTVYGALWSPLTFWDGRAGPAFIDPQDGSTVIPLGGGLEAQAITPILADNEMAHQGRTWTDVISKLQGATPMALATYLPPDMEGAIASNPTYADLFDAAFGDPAITARRIGLAIATYERTLVPNQTPFDLGTLTPQQQLGLNVFQGLGARCSLCHAPPIFSDNSFRNIGVRPIGEDIGRQGVTGVAQDAGRFKVPSLRNVGLKSTFMHNGRRSTLTEVVDFYARANGQIQFPANQDPLIPLINLPPQARIDLIAFLQGGLTDPRVATESFPFDRPILASERGDADRDDDVDTADRAQFETCYTGQGGGPVSGVCQRVDMDGDGDVACDDWTAFTNVWTEGSPPAELAACPATQVPTVSEWGVVTIALLLATAGTLTLRRSQTAAF